MKNQLNNILQKRKSEAGIGVVEVLITAVLFIIITGAIFGLLQVARVDRNRASRRSDTLKNARAAMHLIGRDALNSGLSYHTQGGFGPDDVLMTRLGLPQDNDTKRDRLTAVIPGNNINTNNLQTPATDEISFIYRDMDFNNAEVIKLKQVDPSPTNSNIPRVTTFTAGTASTVSVHDLFLIETEDSMQVPVMVTAVPSTSTVEFALGDPLGFNQSLNGTGTARSLLKVCSTTITSDCLTLKTKIGTMKKFFWVSYQVSSDGTLIRTVFGNNTSGAATDQIRQQPLAYGVQDMQVRYVLENGTVTDNPTVGPNGIPNDSDDTPGDMNLVRQITVTLKLQSSEIDEQRRTSETITISSTYATRNIAFDAG